MDLLIGIGIGTLGGYVLFLTLHRNEREKVAAEKDRTAARLLEAQNAAREARCLRHAARMDAEFVESVLVTDSKVFQR